MGLLDSLFRRKPKLKVLIADDSALQVAVFKQALESMGHAAIEAPTSRDVFPMAVSEKPDLILLDVNMEGFTGIEILQQLKYDIKTYYIPVLMCTAEITKVTIDRAMKMGAVGYVLKPIDARRLEEKLTQLMRNNVVKPRS